MTAALIFLISAQSDPLVSIDLRARPVREVLQTISESTKVSHECAPSHANEILVLRFKDKPVSEVRKKLAWALDATWTETPKGWTLARTEARTREIEAEAKAYRKKEVETLFAKIRESMKSTPTAYTRIQAALKSAPSGDLDAPVRSSPAGYWLLQTWLEIGADVVASSPLEGYITYSNLPNKAQRALPAGGQKALDNMREELLQIAQDAPDSQVWQQHARKPLKVIVKIYRIGSTYRIWLTAYGAAGEELYSFGYSSSNILGSAYDKPDELGKRALAEVFNLSPLQSEFEKVRDPKAEISGILEPIPKMTASPELLDALLNPEKVDPLDYWNAESILRWAGDKSVCVCLPDRFDFATRSCLQRGKFQLGKLKAIAEATGSLKTVPEPNWHLGRPVNSLSSERTRFNRAAFGSFLRSSYENKAERFEDYAKYSWEAGKQSVYFGFWSTIRKTMWKLGVEPYPESDSHPYETWSLVGSMNKSMAALQRGELLTYAQATPRQKELMVTMAVWNGAELEPGTKVLDIQLESTEFMENGLSPYATFGTVGMQDIGIRRVLKSPTGGSMERVLSASDIGKQFAREPKLDLTNYGQIEMGMRSRILTRFKPAANLQMDETFETGFTQKSKPFDSKNLPEEFLKAAELAHRAERSKATGG